MHDTVSSVSVVVPTYNSKGLVLQTLQAILAQTRSPDEVIVVDDGSTDGTEQVLHGLPVQYHRIENGGPGKARNAGVSHAKSDWIAFCDQDDLWRPTYLERFTAHMAPESFYGFANWVDVMEDTWTDQKKFDAAPPGFFDHLDVPLYQNLIEFAPIWPSAVLMRRSFFYQIGGFNPKFSRFATEDFEFTLRCNEHAPAVVMMEALVGIRKHHGNYSAGRVRQQLSDAAILEWARDHHATGRTLQVQMDNRARRWRLMALDEAFITGDMGKVREIAALPIQSMPARARAKVLLAQSRVVPGAVVRHLFGRSGPERPPGEFSTAPATQE